MVDPIQYLSPGQAGGFAQGYSLGNEMIQSRLLNAANEEKLRQQQLATQQAQRQQEVLSNLMQKVRDGKVTSSDYEAATIELPNLREQMKQAFDIHSDKTKQGIVSEMSQVYSALSSKRPDLAKSVLQTRIDSMKNSGAPESEIQQVQTMLDNIETSPDFVMLNTGMMLQSIPGGDKVFQALDERRKQELQPGEVKKQEGELRQQVAQLGLTKAQANEARVRTNNLGIDGAIKRLELEAIRSGKSQTGKPTTEDEKKSAGYAIRLQNNLNLINGILKKNPDAAQPNAVRTALGNMSIIGKAASDLLASSDRQRVEAAQLDMLDAALTLNTGAAYTREQLEGMQKSYFPTSLDSDEAIKDKNNRLQSLIDTAMVRAGGAKQMAEGLIKKPDEDPQGGSLQVVPPDIAALLAKHGAK